MTGILVAPTFVSMVNLRDVNDAAKADQYGLVWDQATGKHVYVALLTGSAADYVQVAATDASSYGFVVDEDNLASDSDTKIPTQQSVKAYVDSVIAGLTALEAADIDTLAEINAIIGDATLVTVEATDASGYGWVIDEDDMTSDSATKVPTQQSVKAYVDAAGGTVLPVADTTSLVKGSADATKIVRLEVDGLTTGTTRVLTVQDADGTIELTGHTHATTDITSGTFADARIAASNVTQHQASLSITESQISDLGTYATEAYVDTAVAGLYDHKGAYNASTNSPDLDTSPSGILKGDAYTVSDAGNFFAVAVEAGDVLIADQDDPVDAGDWTIVNRNIDSSAFAAASHTHATTDITSGTFADARIAASNVTQHQASLSITESQISDLGTYAAASHTHAASDITSGTLAHERGGLEADISTIAIGDILAGTGTGTVGIITATGHSDGDVLTIQADGSVDFETPAGGGGGDTLPVVDTTGIAKGSVDATKIVRLEVDGLTTGTTRVLTVQDADGTIELTSHTHSLDDLTDADMTTTAPATGDLLTFDGTNWVVIDVGTPSDDDVVKWSGSNWTIGAAPAASVSLDDLTDADMTTTAPATGDLLTFDGTNWVVIDVGTPSDDHVVKWSGSGWIVGAAPAGSVSLDDLTDADMTTTAPATGDLLTFDGTNWVVIDVGTPSDDDVVKWSGSNWTIGAAPAGGTIGTGETWTARSATEASQWLGLTYGNGLFVAVNDNGTDRVMTSPDGINWTARTAAEANQWRRVAYGNGLFVAVADSGTNRVMTSPDGITWTARSATEANTWQVITYGGGLFVAISATGTNRVMTSPDGVNWTARSATEAVAWQSAVYGNGLFVAVNSNGTNRVMTSPDGITWTARSAAEANSWQSVTYGNGLFVAVSSTGTNRVMTSPDGITWTARSAAEANTWNRVTYGNGLFVAVSSDGTNRVMTSPDGITWTARSAAEANSWYGLAYGNGLFVATSNSGTNRVMTSGKQQERFGQHVPAPLIGTEDEADGATIAIDFDHKHAKTIFVDALGGNRTLTFANPIKGGHYSIKLLQDGTGSRTVTWPSSGVTINWSGGSAPTLTTTASKADWIVLVCSDDTSGALVFDGGVALPNV